jgi:outer membrane protein OmpA-like peptidoglycan-associated protein
LWWHNPNDYSYNALKNSKAPQDSKCDKDADGDGISDCFDRCPNTPGGVSVDSHGCPFDTDGDGVADYKDKQLITPTECQPVDADGVGKCPEPACCTGIVNTTGCSAIAAGSVEFSSGSAKLSSSSMAQLNTLAGSMRSNPNCKTVVIGNGSGSKIEQQRSWDRVNSVINYMVDKQGIDRERFIFQYGNNGNANSVDYRSAGNGEEGPSNTPPPFPNLRKN